LTLEASSICATCGSKVDEQARFCASCGADLSIQQAVPEAIEPVPEAMFETVLGIGDLEEADNTYRPNDLIPQSILEYLSAKKVYVKLEFEIKRRLLGCANTWSVCTTVAWLSFPRPASLPSQYPNLHTCWDGQVIS
jgi:hypothetical protein